MSGRSGMMILVAIICGLGAMYGAQKMLAKDTQEPKLQEVLAAARDLRVEEVLEPDMVKVIKVRIDNVPPGAFESYKGVADRWVKIPILAGEPIVDGKLAPKGAPTGILARIPNGMMAYAIEVNEQSGVSGFVLPENRVDVILARDRNRSGRQTGASTSDAETILENVLVLAAGTAVTRPDDPSIQARTVTLALTPEAINTLVASRSEGLLNLALRGHNSGEEMRIVKRIEPEPEPEPIPVPVPTPIEPPAPPPVVVQAPPPEPEPEPEPPPRFVHFYRGPPNWSVQDGGNLRSVRIGFNQPTQTARSTAQNASDSLESPELSEANTAPGAPSNENVDALLGELNPGADDASSKRLTQSAISAVMGLFGQKPSTPANAGSDGPAPQ